MYSELKQLPSSPPPYPNAPEPPPYATVNTQASLYVAESHQPQTQPQYAQQPQPQPQPQYAQQPYPQQPQQPYVQQPYVVYAPYQPVPPVAQQAPVITPIIINNGGPNGNNGGSNGGTNNGGPRVGGCSRCGDGFPTDDYCTRK